MKFSVYSPSIASILCSSCPVPRVDTTIACVSPLVNKAEPCVLGRKRVSQSIFLTLSSFVIFVVVSKTLDFFLAISALSIFVSYCWGEKRLFYLLLVGIIFPIIVFIFFETILGLRFPPGIITNIYYS